MNWKYSLKHKNWPVHTDFLFGNFNTRLALVPSWTESIHCLGTCYNGRWVYAVTGENIGKRSDYYVNTRSHTHILHQCKYVRCTFSLRTRMSFVFNVYPSTMFTRPVEEWQLLQWLLLPNPLVLWLNQLGIHNFSLCSFVSIAQCSCTTTMR